MTLIHKDCGGEVAFSDLYPKIGGYSAGYFCVKCKAKDLGADELTSAEYP